MFGFYALLVDGVGVAAGGEAELDLAFVADEAQGLGIGRLLMEHMAGRPGPPGRAP